MKTRNLIIRSIFSASLLFLSYGHIFAQPARLIVRSDDMGAFHSVNEACLEVCKNGICTTVEVMPVCGWFPEAVKMLKQVPQIEVGIHLTLTSEWENVKWRPLTDCPSLTDEDGYFYPMLYPSEIYPSLSEADWAAGEVEKELRAQIELTLKHLPRANHLSGHMSIMRFPGMAEITHRLAEEYGLMHLESPGQREAVTFVGYDGESRTAEQKEEAFIKMLAKLENGRNYIFLDHPATDSDEMKAVYHIGYENVLEDRAGVTKLFTSEKVKSVIAERGIELTDYAGVLRALDRTSPQAAGIDAGAIDAFLAAAEKEEGIELHSFMLLKGGKVISEKWFGEHGPRVPHQMWSVSKTVTACAVGIAVEEGLFSIDDKVISFFPDKLPAHVSENLANLTVRNLLTMSVGHDLAAVDKVRNGEGDWVEGFLGVPIDKAPGSEFEYNSMATFMLSAILDRVTGQSLLDYLYPRMLTPLGISGIYTYESPQGIHTGGWGKFLKTEDMAKIGQLLLNRGNWNGRQIIPSDWVQEMSSPQIANWPAGTEPDPASDWHQGYGYQMWVCVPDGVFRADGAYGQYIIVMPQQDAVIAITSQTANMQKVLTLIWEILLPVLW